MRAEDSASPAVETAAVLRALLRRLAHRSPDWFAGLPVPQDIQARILGSAELCDRLARQIALTHQLGPLAGLPRLTALDARLVAEGLNNIALDHAGLIWWSAVLATEVHGPRAGVLRERFGTEALAWALAQRDLSAGRFEPRSIEQLLSDIAAAGQLCRLAWQAALPPAWQAWLTLDTADTHNATAPPSGTMPVNNTQGAAIVQRVARYLAGAAPWEMAA